ncbi:transcription factor STE12 [Enteropsectra breve]|nr:transcription factor STE12 [Enteropsectra breve]
MEHTSLQTLGDKDLYEFLVNCPKTFRETERIRKFQLKNGDYIHCVLWNYHFYITGTDIVKILVWRFQSSGRQINSIKKFEEGIFSDLRNLKPGIDATLEGPRSDFLEFLYKNGCIRTQKKQKVFYWYSVPHDALFCDAVERDMRRDSGMYAYNAYSQDPERIPTPEYQNAQHAVKGYGQRPTSPFISPQVRPSPNMQTNIFAIKDTLFSPNRQANNQANSTNSYVSSFYRPSQNTNENIFEKHGASSESLFGGSEKLPESIFSLRQDFTDRSNEYGNFSLQRELRPSNEPQYNVLKETLFENSEPKEPSIHPPTPENKMRIDYTNFDIEQLGFLKERLLETINKKESCEKKYCVEKQPAKIDNDIDKITGEVHFVEEHSKK